MSDKVHPGSAEPFTGGGPQEAPPAAPEAVWVIFRETGEYSDRMVTPIRFVLSEAEAQQAVERAEVEARTVTPIPYPDSPSPYGWQRPDGSFDEAATFRIGMSLEGLRWGRRPDADEREAASNADRAAWEAATEALGCVDPGGPEPDARYYAEPVKRMPTLRAAPGMAALGAVHTGQLRDDDNSSVTHPSPMK